MAISKHLLFAALLLSAWINILVKAHHEDRAGFISIDCGSPDTSYTDEQSEITYFSDKSFINSGENMDILASYKVLTDEQQFWNVRSFPEGARNCYTLQPSGEIGSRYLIRARFMYGNYDNMNKTPKFDLHIGVDLWDTVKFQNALGIVTKEVIHVLSSDHINVCLVNTGSGNPFISVLELRPLRKDIYETAPTSLVLVERYDFGAVTNQTMRYEDDLYDRLWSPVLPGNNWIRINTSVGKENLTQNVYGVPYEVMSTAYTGSEFIGLNWKNLNTTTEFDCFAHFAELEKLESNESREFNIYINDELKYRSFVPKYLNTTTLSTSGTMPVSDGNILILFNKTENSTLPPLVNALEIYQRVDNPGQETYRSDVIAISNIKLAYELEIISWQGDPCAPKAYVWDGLACNYSKVNLPPRVTSLNLSSSGLKGEISPYIANLTALIYLDLSNNRLNGTLPEFFAELSSLRVLNLKGNTLKGPIPPTLLERLNNGLSLSVDASVIGSEPPQSPNTNGTSSSAGFSCRKNKFVVSMVASLGGLILNFVL